MARTAILITTGTVNGAVTITSNTIDATNSHNIAVGSFTRRLILRVNNTTGSAKAITIKAGNYPPAMRADLGDLVLSIPASTVQEVIVESARFVQTDGSINIDIAAGMTGTIEALQIPSGAA